MVRFLCMALMVAIPVISASEIAAAVNVTDLTFVYGIYGGWAYYSGTAAVNGGAAGEWTARVDGRLAVGYFFNPLNSNMTGGSVANLGSLAGGYKAAWLIDNFALGLGNEGTPAGWAGDPVSSVNKRAALALAVFEVGMSPPGDPLDLDDGHFRLFFTDAVLVSFGQAYLNALASASPDESALEAKYDVLIGNQWNGNAYATWIAIVEQPVLSRIDVAPSNATLHVGEQRIFAAAGTDQFGDSMAFTPIWSASGGPIDGAGCYMPTNTGVFAVVAESAGSPVRGTNVVMAVAIPITGIAGGPPFAVTFPSYTTTLYRLQHRSNLMTGGWADLSVDARGEGGPMVLTDTNDVKELMRFYRLNYFVHP